MYVYIFIYYSKFFENGISKALDTYRISEEDHIVDIENVEVIQELGGLVKELDDNIEG